MHTFKPKSRQEQLAYTMAKTFQELNLVNRYLSCCKRYPLRVIQRAFRETKAVEDTNIKKSRAALFFYLIKVYEQKFTNHSRYQLRYKGGRYSSNRK